MQLSDSNTFHHPETLHFQVMVRSHWLNRFRAIHNHQISIYPPKMVCINDFEYRISAVYWGMPAPFSTYACRDPSPHGIYHIILSNSTQKPAVLNVIWLNIHLSICRVEITCCRQKRGKKEKETRPDTEMIITGCSNRYQ